MPSRKNKVRKSRRPRKVKSRRARKKTEKSRSPKTKKSRSPKGKKLPRPRVITMADLMSDLPSTKLSRKTHLPSKLTTKAHGTMSEIIWDSAPADNLDDIKKNIRESFKKKFPGKAKNSKLAKGIVKLAKKLFEIFDKVPLVMVQD